MIMKLHKKEAQNINTDALRRVNRLVTDQGVTEEQVTNEPGLQVTMTRGWGGGVRGEKTRR